MELIKQRAGRAGLYILYGLLAYMPLHIFLSTWLGTTFGLLEPAKIAKDVVLVVGFALTLFAAWDFDWLRAQLRRPLIILIGAYALLTVVYALIFDTHQRAELLGVVYNLRFLLVFLYVGLLLRFFKPAYLRRRLLQIVLAVGVLVAAFGVVQYTVLPDDALTHAGYSRENGVLPAFHIDDKPDLERVMSTIRDPNTLGSYMVMIIPLLLAELLAAKQKDLRMIFAGCLALAVLAAVYTFSRSGWLGVMLSLLTFGSIWAAGRYRIGELVKRHKMWVIVSVLIISLLGVGLFAARDTYFVQNVILHSDESTTLEDPNELRLRFWRESLGATAAQPLGYGPGTAGLTSVHSDHVILNENYYFQLLHEVGVVGLLLFLAILAIVGAELYRAYRVTGDYFALGLFATFTGLLLTNFLVHIWSNEAIAYTFWTLAGMYIASTARRERN